MAARMIDHQNDPVRQASSEITPRNRWDHFMVRLGIRRDKRRVALGLYALGNPGRESPVFVTANYRLSYDALRSALKGFDGFILVLDTRGINVWCASGGGLFSTDEVVRRVEEADLLGIVGHRSLILPQLSGPGVAAHEVKARSGFTVEYGPVRAADLPEYLKTRTATPEMRRVRFHLRDRLLVVPVELVHALWPTLIAAVLLFFLGGPWLPLGLITAVLSGLVLFPILLPWVPTPNFSTKGYLLGGAAALPFVLGKLIPASGPPVWQRIGLALAAGLLLPAVTAFLALNFTGSTVFTSKTGVRREIFRYFPVMAWMFGGGLVCAVTLFVIRLLGGS